MFASLFGQILRRSVAKTTRSMTERQLHSGEGRRHIVAVCQLTATNDKEKNFEICQTLIRRASHMRAEVSDFQEIFFWLDQFSSVFC